MTTKKLERLEKALRDQALQLEELLTHPQRGERNHYLWLAGHLRVLLCDEKYVPILIAYADARGIPLNITPVVGNDVLPSPKGIKICIPFATYSWPKADDRRSVGTIQQFLGQIIGYDSIGEGEGRPYTPRQVIKWVANKEGVSHLDFERPYTFQAVMKWQYHRKGHVTEGFIVQRLIYDLAEWALIAIEHVLPAKG